MAPQSMVKLRDEVTAAELGRWVLLAAGGPTHPAVTGALLT